MNKLLSFIFLALALTSCLVGPRYSRPDVKPPKNWLETNQSIHTPDTIANLKWFTLYQDTVLNSLINKALSGNFNLKNAVLRIEQAEAQYGIARADVLPSFGYSAKGEFNTPTANAYSLFGTATWEIDFWGKLRHASRAAYDQLLASEEGRIVVYTTLISNVSALYFQMRDLDNRYAIANRTFQSRTEYFNLVDARFKGGDVAELDKLQAEQQLAVAKATMSSVKRQLSATERSLNLLLGQSPQAIPRGLENTDQTEFPVIPAGLPSSLLEQRPDVKQAEFQLQAQTERIGVYQAMRFPSVSLTGFIGLANPEISSLISDASFAANATASILGPIFSFGQNKRRVDAQRKETEIAANTYVYTYLSAIAEVEDALVSVQTYRDEYDARRQQADAATKALMLSQERYRNGYTDYLEVLVAENAMLDSELAASSTRAQQLSSYINLYRALGGGW
jgi:outer membrane protein, multidrug efflux system